MTKSMRLVAGMASCLAVTVSGWAGEAWVKYAAKAGPGNLVFIEGTSTVHDWRVEGKIIGGAFEAGPGFTTDLAEAKPGKVEAKASAFMPVRSLKSVKEDGTYYSNSMDDIMYEKMLEPQNKLIKYTLKEMELKEVPKSTGEPFLFETKGDLMVAGATKEVVMPVKMKVEEVEESGKKWRVLTFSAEIEAKMTDFKVEPVSALGGTIKTGDDIKLGINWVTRAAR